MSGNTQQPESGISPRLVLIMAIACGVAVANLYYAQPLLEEIAHAFHTGAATAGTIITMSQAGYAAGLLLLVPAGDILDRRKLILTVLSLSPLALVLAALSPSVGFLIATATAIGVASVIAQVLLPFAASLANDSQRGRVVGTVMSGLLIGILMARTFSGILADLAGWRAVYYVAAATMIVLTFLLRRELPEDHHKPAMSYAAAIRSVGRLLSTEPTLRRRSLYGALVFATFSLFWTTVAFVLSGPPYHYSESIIGLFGLLGAAGATAASLVGRLADRGYARSATGALAAMLMISFLFLWMGGHSLAAMMAGVILLDVAVQGIHVFNQSEIFRLNPEARSRINSAYMTCYFVGGASGSAAGAALYASAGWTPVTLMGGLLGLASLLLWTVEMLGARRAKTA